MDTNILWIHGWGMSSQIWGDVSTFLPGFNHHFFTYDGCDTSDSFLDALHDKLLCSGGNTSWTLIGWSLGGMLAIEQWMNCSEDCASYTIQSLIIVAGSLRFANSNRQLGWPERVLERMRKQLQLDPQGTLQQFAGSMLSASEQQRGEAFNTLKDTITKCGDSTDFTSAGLDAGLAYLQKTDLTASWEQFKTQLPPLLWLHGADDSICLIGAMPDLSPAEVYVFPETGHLPFLTQPVIFFDKVRSFLHANRSENAR